MFHRVVCCCFVGSTRTKLQVKNSHITSHSLVSTTSRLENLTMGTFRQTPWKFWEIQQFCTFHGKVFAWFPENLENRWESQHFWHLTMKHNCGIVVWRTEIRKGGPWKPLGKSSISAYRTLATDWWIVESMQFAWFPWFAYKSKQKQRFWCLLSLQ